MSLKKISPKLNCHQNWNITEAAMSPKLKCHLNWNVTITKMLPKLKCHKIQKCPKNLNLNLNLNQGDWHWPPWSCSIYFRLLVTNKPYFPSSCGSLELMRLQKINVLHQDGLLPLTLRRVISLPIWVNITQLGQAKTTPTIFILLFDKKNNFRLFYISFNIKDPLLTRNSLDKYPTA